MRATFIATLAATRCLQVVAAAAFNHRTIAGEDCHAVLSFVAFALLQLARTGGTLRGIGAVVAVDGARVPVVCPSICRECYD